MIKIKSLFVLEFTPRRVITKKVTPGCEWVMEGKGTVSRKFDGTACMVKDGKLYKRYDAKKGKKPPVNAIPCTFLPDDITGHWPHWILVDGNDKSNKWHLKAFVGNEPDGTYELCGKKINGNPECVDGHWLIKHGDWTYGKSCIPRTFEGIKEFVANKDIEGIVFCWKDNYAKVKKSYFGMKRN